MMEEDDILRCETRGKKWKCPICDQLLSRKQTLKNHISNQHDTQAGQPPKRYKQYEVDQSVPVPRRAAYRKKALGYLDEVNPSETYEADQEESLQISYSEPMIDPDDITGTCAVDVAAEADVDMHEMDVVSSDTDDSDDGDEHDSDPDNRYEDKPISQPQCLDNDPPLYVIPPRDSLFNCPITRSDHLIAVSAVVSKHNMSATMTRDVLKLIQLGMPENNICETSFEKLQQSCGFDSDYLKYHLYCECCKKLFDMKSDQDQCKTPECIGSKTTNQSYFVTGSMEVQLKEILEREGMWETISESRNANFDTSSLSDIRCGFRYKKLQEPGGFLHNTSNISLSMFIDGIPLYKSSSVSLWPVYLLINEIPPRERFRKKNMVLWGVWQGVGKPNMNMFLRPLVNLIDLYTNGISISVSSEICEAIVNVRAMLVIATMDLQARAYVANMTQHNGEHGCLYCLHPGEVVPSGKGHCRAYLPKDQPPPLRTTELARASAIEARQTGVRRQGFLGEAVLWYLPYFSPVQNIVIDYMHGTLLGVTKKLLDFWFDSSHSNDPFSIKKNVADIDKLLKQIKPPYVIHRLPRAITNTYQHWKASELRNWLLFYSLPCLLGCLPDVFLTHFSCLAEATFMLLTEGISPQDLERADMLLKSFVKNTPLLYGDNAATLNVHNLLHLTDFVRQWGPLWAWSCFPFESFNGEIKRSVHGTGNVCKQIFWALQAQKRVEAKSRHETSQSVKDFLHDVMDSRSERFGSDSEAFQCCVVKSSKLLPNLNAEVTNQLKIHTGTDKHSDFLHISKIARNGFQMYCKSCTKGKKQNSYTIKLEVPMDGNFDIVEVNYYVMEKKSKRVFAIGQMLSSCESILPRRVPHMQRVQEIGSPFQVVAAENLFEPLVIVKGRHHTFASRLPNNTERD